MGMYINLSVFQRLYVSIDQIAIENIAYFGHGQKFETHYSMRS